MTAVLVPAARCVASVEDAIAIGPELREAVIAAGGSVTALSAQAWLRERNIRTRSHIKVARESAGLTSGPGTGQGAWIWYIRS